jgi:xanthine dehydrogenase accessory factor
MLITDLDYNIDKFAFSESDSVVVLTKGERDVGILETLSKKKTRFVGLLASMQRVSDDFAELKRRGVSQEFIDSVHAPIGVDIGAVSPEEISLSIMADIVATKHGKHLPHKALAGELSKEPSK